MMNYKNGSVRMVRLRPKSLDSHYKNHPHRHSMHGLPAVVNSNNSNNAVYMDPYQSLYPPMANSVASIRPSACYFNQFDGYIYFDRPQVHVVQRKDVARRSSRNEKRRAFGSVPPPLHTSSPPPLTHAPYYVSDTIQDRSYHSLNSSRSSGEEASSSGNSGSINHIDQSTQARHQFDIRDYTLLPETDVGKKDDASSGPFGRPETKAGAEKELQPECCRCECHFSSAEHQTAAAQVGLEEDANVKEDMLYQNSFKEGHPSLGPATSSSPYPEDGKEKEACSKVKAATQGKDSSGNQKVRTALFNQNCPPNMTSQADGVNSELCGRPEKSDSTYSFVLDDDQKGPESQRGQKNSAVSASQPNRNSCSVIVSDAKKQLLEKKIKFLGGLRKSESVRVTRSYEREEEEDCDGNEISLITSNNKNRISYAGVGEVKRRVKRIVRSPSQKVERSDTMVFEGAGNSPHWLGVSGVPGLGVSIPKRPQSACEFDIQEAAWCGPSKFTFLPKNKERKSRRNIKESNLSAGNGDSSSPHSTISSSQEDESSSSNSSWTPHSLQPLSHIKLDLPRVHSAHHHHAPGSNQGSLRSKRASSIGSKDGHDPKRNGKRSSSQHPPNASAISRLHQLATLSQSSHSQPNSLVSIRKEKVEPSKSHQVSSQQVHAQVHWKESNSSSGAPLSMPWDDHVFNPAVKKPLQRQSTHHFQTDTEQAILERRRNSEFQTRFPHLAAILRNESTMGGPNSLPLRIDDAIPRAPIAPPQQKSIASTSDSSDDDDKSNSIEKKHSHYEKLNRHKRKEFSRKSLIQHVNSSSGDTSFDSSKNEDTFESLNFPSFIPKNIDPGSQLYKVLNDRDGDYAYAYDCSLSPAFLIKYDAENLPSNEDSENIYEEISEVRKRNQDEENPYEFEDKETGSDSFSSKDNEEEKVLNTSSDSSSTKSSLNNDSGVHFNHRKFSSDTLDFGPKGKIGTRQISRFSNSSSDSFGSSELSEESRSSQAKDELFNKHKAELKMTRSVPVKAVSDEEFCEIIRKHHNKVLDQLKLNPDDLSPDADNDSGIQDAGSNPKLSSDQKKVSLSKFKKFGFGTKRGKSDGNVKVSKENQDNKTPNQPISEGMKRMDSMDVSIEKSNGDSNNSSRSGWFNSAKKYSEAFLAKLPVKGGGKDETKIASIKEENLDDDLTSISFTIDRNQPRLTRSQITSQWENLHSLPE